MGSLSDMPTPKISQRRFSLSKEFVRSMIDNPSDIDRYDRYFNVAPETVTSSDSVHSGLRAINVLEEVVPDYVIITNNQLKGAFQKLADWRTKTGMPTIIKTVEEIVTEYHGGYLVDKIRSYLQDVQKRWSNNSLFILLGGDIEIVPSRIVRSDYRQEYGTLQVTDDVYTALSYTWTPWDPYKSYEYTNERETSSYLGRIPVKNAEEATVYIDKLLNYEKAPENSSCDYSYFNNFLVADAFLSKSGKEYGAMPYLDGYCKVNKHQQTKYWYLFDHFGCKLNDHSPADSYDTTYGGELNKLSFLSAFQRGCSFDGQKMEQFHFVYHMDHSWPTNMGVSCNNKGEVLFLEDVRNMPNSNYPKIIMSGGCHPADFSRDCMAEEFLKKPKGGAVAFIGNTDVGYISEDWQFERLLFPLFKIEQQSPYQYTIGYLFQKANIKEKEVNKNGHRLHLLGDPAMPVWTTVPKKMNINHYSNQMTSGDNLVYVVVKGLPQNQQALICLMKGEEVYATKTVTAKDSIGTFLINPRTSGAVNVTVTAHNYRPYEGTVNVQGNGNTSVHISDMSFNDSPAGSIAGNGNGMLDAGETVEVTMKLKNSGTMTVNNIRGVLKCRSEHITVLSDTVSFGNIASQATAEGRTKFKFRVSANAPKILKNDFSAVEFLLNLKDNKDKKYYEPEFGIRNI